MIRTALIGISFALLTIAPAFAADQVHINEDGVQAGNVSITKDGIHVPGASITGTNISIEQQDSGAEAEENASYTNAQIDGMNFHGQDLHGANFVNASLKNANFENANLTEANFTNADLTEANLNGADLTRANLTNATLTKAQMIGSILTKTIMTNADMSSVLTKAPASTVTQAAIIQKALTPSVGHGPAKIDLTINFDFNSDKLTAQGLEQITQIAKALKAMGKVSILVEGHTDSVGGDDYNLRLSTRRAQSVVRELSSTHHLSETDLIAKGYGEAQPVDTNDTDLGRAKNRRVTLVNVTKSQ